MEQEQVKEAVEETAQTKEEAAPETPEKSFTQADIDRIVQERLGREKGKWQREQAEKIAEEKRLSKLSAEERTAERLKVAEERAAALEAEKTAILLRQDTVTELAKRGLPGEFADFLTAEDAQSTMERLDAFEGAFRDAVEAAVNTRLKGSAPRTGSSGGDSTAAFMAAIRANQARRN